MLVFVQVVPEAHADVQVVEQTTGVELGVTVTDGTVTAGTDVDGLRIGGVAAGVTTILVEVGVHEAAPEEEETVHLEQLNILSLIVAPVQKYSRSEVSLMQLSGCSILPVGVILVVMPG